MEVIKKPLRKKEIAQMVENDMINFTVQIDPKNVNKLKRNRNRVDCYEECRLKCTIGEQISMAILGNYEGLVHKFEIVEVNEKYAILSGRMDVSNYLFGDNDGSLMISEWVSNCDANIAYANNNKDLYEGKWD